MTDIVGLCVRNSSWFIDPVICSIMDVFFQVSLYKYCVLLCSHPNMSSS